MADPWKRDLRPAAFFQRFHQRSRAHNPRLQALITTLLLPLMILISRLRVRIISPLPKGAYIAACNHPSQLDGVFVAIALGRRVHFMGKSDLFTDKTGGLLSRLGVFPVRRGVWDTEAFATAEQVLARGKALAMFVEGGLSPIPDAEGFWHWLRRSLPQNFQSRADKDYQRARGMRYRPAKPGIGFLAHRSGVPVVPIHISGTRGLYRPWRLARVTVIIGEQMMMDQHDQPTHEQNRVSAERILARITALGNCQ